MVPTPRDEHDDAELTVVADMWSPACTAIRTFLARNEIACRWVQPTDPAGRELLEDHGFTVADTPVLFGPDGRTLRPTDEEQLAQWAGLHTKPTADDYDLLIVGGGPAGMAAALYGASEGLRTILLERWAIGGQAGLSSSIQNYLGFPDGISGSELTDRARRQACKFGAELVISLRADHLRPTDHGFAVHCTDDITVTARSVIIATGATFRTLDIPSVDEFNGRGVFYFSALTEAPLCSGSDVYIVGGANSAGQAAVYFASCARRVIMLVRADSLAVEMSTYLIEQIEAIPPSRSAPASKSSTPRATPISNTSPCATARPGPSRKWPRPGCSPSSAPTRPPSGSTDPSPATTAATSSPAPISPPSRGPTPPGR
ncbi:FAD-dependent oxidoreductase [Nocardia sp. NPDC127606]|uniref:NAD(P)/FAD-dependent oxidoreductase n=1 Tax=Nocardia sp. NPDC127606 TaxID=3345406 RepID=UPI00363BB615